MKTEVIIILAVASVALYIFIQYSITNKKLTSKTASKKSKNSSKDKVEAKTIIAPKQDYAELERRRLLKEQEIMRKAVQQSIEYERKWKEKLKQQKEEVEKASLSKEKKAEETKTLKDMEERLNKINLSEEEQEFVNEVDKLSPELKAILFADLLKRYE